MREGFFEPGENYELRFEQGHVGAEFRCLGVGAHPYTGAQVAAGYWRLRRMSGYVSPWELRDKTRNSWDLNPWFKAEKEEGTDADQDHAGR